MYFCLSSGGCFILSYIGIACCQPCDWFRNTADRRQPVRGKLPDRGSGHADRKEGYADDRFLPCGTAADYVYSGDFDWNFIGRSEGQ